MAQPPLPKCLVLVEPPFDRLYHDRLSLIQYPLALGYLAGAVLKWTDWPVHTYNADFNTSGSITTSTRYVTAKGHRNYLRNLEDPAAPIWGEVRGAIESLKPSIVGISAKSQNFRSAVRVAKLCKAIDPRIQVIVGGPHPTLSGEAVFDVPEIDLSVVGEGEITLVETLRAMDAGADLANVPGLLFRVGARVVHTPPRPFLQDLDQLPFPSESAGRVLKDYERYPAEAFRFIFGLRGCPYACLFCGSRNIWSRRVRFRSPGNIVEEIKYLMQEKDLRFLHFSDDNFGVKKPFIRELCERLIRECPNAKWACEASTRILDDENLSLMKRAGCSMVQIGVESGNNEMLRKIRKNVTIQAAHETVRRVRKHGIEVQTFFIVGFPEETPESLADTLEAIRTMDADVVWLSIFTPYPGTEAFELCRRLGLVDDSYDVSLYNHQSPENCFTARIPRDHFRELATKAVRLTDRKNDRRKLRRSISILRQRGIGALAAKAYRFLRGRLTAG